MQLRKKVIITNQIKTMKSKKEKVADLEATPANEAIKEESTELEVSEVISATSNPIHAKALKLLSERTKQEILDYTKKYNIKFEEGKLVDAVAKWLVDRKPGAVEMGRI